MYVRFWGTRGSIAAPGRDTARFGGNTSCVELRASDGSLIVLDCGTGARDLGMHLLERGPRPLRVNLLIGHTHWDHIQGFPFFGPAFLPGAEVNVFAPLGFQQSLGEAMSGQMEYSYFPVKLKDLRSRIHFTELEEGFFRLGEVLVETQYLNHTAPTIAYRLTNVGSTIVYVTDHEPFWRPATGRFEHPGDQRHIAFLRGASLVIHDAQYTDSEYESHVGWGHSPIRYATAVALAAGVQRLALFHHDPTHDDSTMDRLESEAREHVASVNGHLDVFAAFEGLELDVKGAGPASTTAESSAFRRVAIGGRRVLVVSSDVAEVAAIEEELSEDGLVVLSVGTAGEVLDRVREIEPDLVILSGAMPDAEPATLVSDVRVAAGRSDFPVVLLTAEGAGEEVYRGAEPTDYLARPFSPPMLRARVRAWLSRTALSDEPSALTSAGRQADRPPAADVVQQQVESAEKYAAMLATMPLFRPIPTGDLVKLTAGAIDQVYAPGHVVVREGTPASALYVIISGRVRVTETGRDTHSELLLSEMGPGEIFGELGVLRNQPRVASVVALERTHCVMLQSEAFITAVESCPPLALGLLHVLAGRLADADRRVARYAPDPLTGLMSPRAFSEHYRRLAAGVRRRRTGAMLVMVDVRDLRSINDVHGYAIGDQVLRATAAALRETTRAADLVTRHGGDEFAVLLTDVDPADVEPVIARLRTRITAAAARHGLPPTVDWTIGTAFSAAPPDPADEFLRDADLDLQRRRRRRD